MTKSGYKNRYAIFIFTVVITIIANETILQYKLNLQKSDAKVINIAGRQRMLSQRIVKHLLYMGNMTQQLGHQYTKDTLHNLINLKKRIFFSKKITPKTRQYLPLYQKRMSWYPPLF